VWDYDEIYAFEMGATKVRNTHKLENNPEHPDKVFMKHSEFDADNYYRIRLVLFDMDTMEPAHECY